MVPHVDEIVKKPISPEEEVIPPWKPANKLKDAQKEHLKYFEQLPRFDKKVVKARQLRILNVINGESNYLSKYKVLSKKRTSIDVIDGDWDFNGRAQLTGPIWQNQMELNYRAVPKPFGYAEDKITILGRKRFVVGGNNLATVVRHETGHQVFGHATKIKGDWVRAWKEIGEEKIQKQLSTYAIENYKEFFAEAFSVYTSSEFKVGILNKALGYDVESIIKRMLELDPSIY